MPTFIQHNIRLDDGFCTRPGVRATMNQDPWFLAAKRILDVTFPGSKKGLRVADLGCLEGGYAVEFARLGFDVLGLDVRQVNIDACGFVKQRTNLPNLQFVRDNAWNIAKYAEFDAIFCKGLFYHVDRPVEFLNLLAKSTARILLLQTHFAEARDFPRIVPRPVHRLIPRVVPLQETGATKYGLSRLAHNEGVPGRWFREFRTARSFRDRENSRRAAWDNKRSFWIQREYLLGAIQDAGFDLIMEQFDGLGPRIGTSMAGGYYRMLGRGLFIGIKTPQSPAGKSHTG